MKSTTQLRELEANWLRREIQSIDETLERSKSVSMPDAVGMLRAELVSARVEFVTLLARQNGKAGE